MSGYETFEWSNLSEHPNLQGGNGSYVDTHVHANTPSTHMHAKTTSTHTCMQDIVQQTITLMQAGNGTHRVGKREEVVRGLTEDELSSRRLPRRS